MKDLKKLWRVASDAYLRAFCEKHGYDFSSAYWVGDDPGALAEVADHFVSMDEMRADIDLNAPEEAFEEWYDYTLEVHEIQTRWHEMEEFREFVHINFSSWIKGAPLPYTKKDLCSMRRNLEMIESAKEKFIKSCRECASGK